MTITSYKKNRVMMSEGSEQRDKLTFLLLFSTADTQFVEFALKALLEHAREVAAGTWCNHLLQVRCWS